MFNRNIIKMENIKLLKPTSKAAAKMSCLLSCSGDIDKAEKLYKFITEDMDLPDFDPVAPSTLQQVKETAGGIFGWIKENQNDLVQGFEMIRGLLGKGKVTPPPTSLPPI